MFDRKIRLISEALARGIDRRDFIKKAGGAVVTGVVAVAMGPTLSKNSPKAYASPRVPTVANCAPPGPYCNIDGQGEPNGCRGASCYQHLANGTIQMCQVFYIYQTTGCWTTLSGNGYWTCCDCTCTGGVSCGCAQYTSAPGVYPD